MKKVIVVSAHFPPLNTMAAKRFGYMCKYFKENGYDYTIISMRSHNKSYLGAKNDLDCSLYAGKIITIGELGITYPLYNILTEFAFLYVNKRGYVSRIMEEQSLGWYEKVKNELDINQVADAVCVIGTFPDIGNILVAKYIGKKLKVPVVADIRDLISDYSEGMNRNRKDEFFERCMERAILCGVTAISTTTSGFFKILRGRYSNKKVITVYNGWDDERESYTEALKENEDDRYLYFAGTLYEHRIESLLMLLRLIKNNDLRVYVKIRSLGPEALTVRLKKALCDEELTDYAEILEPAKEYVVREEQQRALINVVPSSLDCNDKALMTTIPGKLFELIRCNRPVLAIISSESEVGRILDECNKGIATSEYDKIVHFIREGYREYKGNKKIDRYSRREQTRNLCNLLDDITLVRRRWQ